MVSLYCVAETSSAEEAGLVEFLEIPQWKLLSGTVEMVHIANLNKSRPIQKTALKMSEPNVAG